MPPPQSQTQQDMTTTTLYNICPPTLTRAYTTSTQEALMREVSASIDDYPDIVHDVINSSSSPKSIFRTTPSPVMLTSQVDEAPLYPPPQQP